MKFKHGNSCGSWSQERCSKGLHLQLSPRSPCVSGRAQTRAMAHPAVRRSGVVLRSAAMGLISSGEDGMGLMSLTGKRVGLFVQTCSSEQLASLARRQRL